MIGRVNSENAVIGGHRVRPVISDLIADDDGNHKDLLTSVKSKCREQGQRAALTMEQDGLHLTVTYDDLWRRASRVAGALIERGVVSGDRVAILAESRPEWAICLLAGFLAETLVVPLDCTLEEGELLDIINDSSPTVLFTSEKFHQTGQRLTKKAKSLNQQLQMNGRPTTPSTETLSTLEVAMPVLTRRPASSDAAMIVYTSGTMGQPKGVVTTYGALSFQIRALQDRFHLTAEDRYLSILPLNHLLEITVVLLYALHVGASIVYAHSLLPADIQRILRTDRITVIVGVPVFFRLLRNNIISHIGNQPLVTRILFRSALSLARYLPAGQLRRLLFSPLYRYLGPTLRFCASGGAYLEPSVVRFFGLLGIPLLQGYGLTETGPVISVNGLRENRPGSIGRPLTGVDVRIDRVTDSSSGEILTRGPHIMAGYYQQPDLTRWAFDGAGWFRTGDIGELDADGYLYITGRCKNLIVLDSGKNVQPEEVEEIILGCSLVQECCVIGRPAKHSLFERKEEVCAVVVPTQDLIAACEGNRARVHDEVETAVMKQVRRLAAFKRPVAVNVTFDELPKSQIRKIKRNEVREIFGGDRRDREFE